MFVWRLGDNLSVILTLVWGFLWLSVSFKIRSGSSNFVRGLLGSWRLFYVISYIGMNNLFRWGSLAVLARRQLVILIKLPVLGIALLPFNLDFHADLKTSKHSLTFGIPTHLQSFSLPNQGQWFLRECFPYYSMPFGPMRFASSNAPRDFVSPTGYIVVVLCESRCNEIDARISTSLVYPMPAAFAFLEPETWRNGCILKQHQHDIFPEKNPLFEIQMCILFTDCDSMTSLTLSVN